MRALCRNALHTKGLRRSRSARYSKMSMASFSRMPDYLREDVSQRLIHSLETYYTIVFIDFVHMKIRRKRSVETEAFYVY